MGAKPAAQPRQARTATEIAGVRHVAAKGSPATGTPGSRRQRRRLPLPCTHVIAYSHPLCCGFVTKEYEGSWIFELYLTCANVHRRVQHPGFSLVSVHVSTRRQRWLMSTRLLLGVRGLREFPIPSRVRYRARELPVGPPGATASRPFTRAPVPLPGGRPRYDGNRQPVILS
jgi:hypothetical protein